MATNKEININGVMTPVTEFSHTAQEIDDATTRALEGGAIDQLLAGKAPDGYGLGGSGASISDCNLATSNGFYKWGSACDNAPFTYGCMIVASRYNTGTINLAQLAFQQTTTAGIARRSVIDGVFGEWEWINPPMVIGVEYRTTERYNGKPVYIKARGLGNMPAASTSKSVTFGTGTEVAIDVTGRMEYNSDTYTIPFDRGNGASAAIFAHGAQVYLLSGANSIASYSAYAVVKYIKTTD